MPGAALVGDAAGFYDPFTGEGVTLALRSAELAADAIDAALRNGRCRCRPATRVASTRSSGSTTCCNTSSAGWLANGRAPPGARP
jgi:flavin-dependent dehydrogenase